MGIAAVVVALLLVIIVRVEREKDRVERDRETYKKRLERAIAEVEETEAKTQLQLGIARLEQGRQPQALQRFLRSYEMSDSIRVASRHLLVGGGNLQCTASTSRCGLRGAVQPGRPPGYHGVRGRQPLKSGMP